MLGRALFWPGHFGAKTFGFFGLCPSSCQPTGFVSLAGKASLISISDAVLFLRSQHVCLPLEFEFRGKSCVFIDLYLVFPTNFTLHKHCNFTGTVLWYYHRNWVTCATWFKISRFLPLGGSQICLQLLSLLVHSNPHYSGRPMTNSRRPWKTPYGDRKKKP